MIKPSPEIEAVVGRWQDAFRGRNGRSLANLFSHSEHLRYLGSAPDENWAGALLRRGIGQHASEVPNFTTNSVTIEGFESGGVGWAILRGQMHFTGRDEVVDIRLSFVLTLDDGDWRIIQVHSSIASSNQKLHGVEQNAFADLIAAARKGQDGFGSEGTAVIMFTDVANSTEIANAVGDRDWAVAIGRQLNQQALAISKFDGTLVKTLGDGSMSSFGSAKSAMRSAVKIQSAGAASPSEPKLKLRVGIHAGDVIQFDGDFFRTVVNKASRITSLAQPNEILVSDVARAMAGEQSEFTFGDPLTVAPRGIEGQHIISNLHWNL